MVDEAPPHRRDRWGSVGPLGAPAKLHAADNRPFEPKHVIADKGYDRDPLHRAIRTAAANSVIPSHRSCRTRRHDRPGYKLRNVVERFINRLKHCRRVATRYDKLAVTFLGFVGFFLVVAQVNPPQCVLVEKERLSSRRHTNTTCRGRFGPRLEDNAATSGQDPHLDALIPRRSSGPEPSATGTPPVVGSGVDARRRRSRTRLVPESARCSFEIDSSVDASDSTRISMKVDARPHSETTSGLRGEPR